MRKPVILSILLCFILFFISYLYFISNYENGNVNKKEYNVAENLDSQKDNLNIQNNVTLLFGGDVMLGRNVMNQSIKNKDYSYPFAKIFNFTKESDIFLVNLENPIIKDCPESNSGFKFCTLPDMVEGLIKAGVNVVSLANNHTLNYGPEGIEQTENYLTKAGISLSGMSNLVVKNFKGITFGFIGFDFTVKSPTLKDYQFIKESDSKVNFLLISVHWGEEYKAKANIYQRKWAKEMIVNGADIIVGSHPHWVQDFECLNYPQGESLCSNAGEDNNCICDGIVGKPVYYSLGNLVFDQMWSEETKKGLLVRLKVEPNKIVSDEWFYTYIKSSGQPELVKNTY
jgi:poly-gamma-glutamate synthesis protein (capsule biosynthesis protein)